MILHSLGVLVTTLCCLLALATSASAESWIIWEEVKHVHVPSLRQATTWELHQAFDTLVACKGPVPLVTFEQTQRWDKKRASGLGGVVSVRVPQEPSEQVWR